MEKFSAAAVLSRLQDVFGASTDTALSAAMGVNRNTLGNWRARASVPYAECVRLANERALSLDWLLMGEGEMHRNAGSVTVDGERESALLTLLRALPEDDQQELLLIAQSKKLLRSMEQRLDDLVHEINSFRTRDCSSLEQLRKEHN